MHRKSYIRCGHKDRGIDASGCQDNRCEQGVTALVHGWGEHGEKKRDKNKRDLCAQVLRSPNDVISRLLREAKGGSHVAACDVGNGASVSRK